MSSPLFFHSLGENGAWNRDFGVPGTLFTLSHKRPAQASTLGQTERYLPIGGDMKKSILAAVLCLLCSGLNAVGDDPKSGIVGRWVSESPDRVPVVFEKDGSLVVRWPGVFRDEDGLEKGTYRIDEKGEVRGDVRRGGLTLAAHFTYRDGVLEGEYGLMKKCKWVRAKNPAPKTPELAPTWKLFYALTPKPPEEGKGVIYRAEVGGEEQAHVPAQTSLAGKDIEKQFGKPTSIGTGQKALFPEVVAGRVELKLVMGDVWWFDSMMLMLQDGKVKYIWIRGQTKSLRAMIAAKRPADEKDPK
jgi:hypothetical protein